MLSSLKNQKLAYKYAQIKTELSIRILNGELVPHDSIPSLNEITENYSVSKITARRVLNDLVAEGLVYAIRGKGSFVADRTAQAKESESKTQKQSIGVVFANASGAYMSDIIEGIDATTYQNGFSINLCLANNSFEREAESLERLYREGIRKILLFTVISGEEQDLNKNLPLYMNLQARGVEIVLITCWLAGVPIPAVTWDDFGGMKHLVRFLNEQGRRRLVYVTRITNAMTNVDRQNGYKEGLLELGMEFNSQSILPVAQAEDNTLIKNCSLAVGEFLTQHSEVDALVCSDEVIAAGVFEALDEMADADVADLMVGGFGNPKSVYLIKDHPYYLLEQDTYKLGSLAAKWILDDLPDDTREFGAIKTVGMRKILPVRLRQPKKRTQRRKKTVVASS